MNNKIKTLSPKRTAKRMYMAIIVILLASLTGACDLMKIYGSGDIVTETMDVQGFNRVVFSGAGELMLSQGDEEMVAVAADDNLIKHIKVEVRDGTLYISHRETISPSQPILIRVSVREIRGLELAGIIEAEANSIFAESLSVDISGVSTLRIKELEADELVVTLSGSTEFELTGTGVAAEQDIRMSGSNTYTAPKLQSQTTTLSLSGTNDATISVVRTLDVTVAGDGSVQYYGSPQVSQTGSGKVSIQGLGNP
ncbi:MAG: head GIN domain-containing protein [Anaerolineales bacterium]|nr:head GIN domain-containing protein [Anaerolineales bacterium]